MSKSSGAQIRRQSENAIKVFKVKQNCDRFRCLHEMSDRPHVLETLAGCKPRGKDWEPPPVHLNNPKLKIGDFLNALNNYLVANTRATELLRPLFAACAEILPLPCEGEMYYVINVTKCVDCLDDNKTVWAIPEGPYRGWIVRHVFTPERLQAGGIFKIPEYGGREIFAVEGLGDRDAEFREIVRRERLTGLLFEEVWSSDARDDEAG